MNIKDIEKLANLCRIDLPEKEKESLLKEMDSILAYVDQVKEAAGAALAAPAASKPLSRNIWREDGEPLKSGEFTESLLSSAPKRRGQYIQVKKIL